MKKTLLSVLSLAAAFSQDKPTTPAAPDQPVTMDIEVGGQARAVDGEKSFGLQRYRDIPRGAFVRRFDFSALTEGNPVRFNFRSIDLLQRDQRFTADLEDVGAWDIRFDWWAFSRYWSNHNPNVLTEVSRGVLTAPSALRGALQGAGGSVVPLAAEAVANAPQYEIRSFRERGIVTASWNLRPGLTLSVNFMRERRTGNRPFAQGTYVRLGMPTGDTFETPGQEMWEPTSYGTTEAGAALDYARRNFFASVEYHASLFGNTTEGLIWQNPFQLTPEQSILPSGDLNRGRFAQTQAALPPDNQAHTVTGRALVLLPRASKLSGVLSWSRWTQDDPFLPFSINSAITAANLPAGVTPTSIAALPRGSLGGLVHTFNQDYVASSRPWRPVQLTFRYNDYDFDNLTASILFPGYAAAGDSWWRTAISGQPGTTPVRIESEPSSFRRKRAQFEAAIRPVDAITWKAAYRWEGWDREHREVAHLTENGFLTSLSFAPRNDVYARAGFRYFDRTPDAYDPGTLEPPFLRMFDQARRLRKQADALLSFNLTPRVTASGSWFYLSDVYDKTFFGLHQQKTTSSSADITFTATENVWFYGGWGYDRTGYDYLAVAKTTFPYSFANAWTRDTRDRVHSAHIGFSGAAAGNKANFQVNYAVALAGMDINTVNPNPIVPTQALNAQAFPFPKVKSQFHELRLDASYEVASRVRVGLFYLLEPFRLNDFAVDTIAPYAPERIAPENDARRYYFLDTGMSNYLGNTAALYLRFTVF
ncbi:MAG TPA: MtrB/PioB family outer membrane beta-barrel protein [Bryobacteraceae bacterium]|nr:MtrB/PioB family outer membrane beta-barrel protein [Bryobacteraceae bacterium]HWR37468.1 MtrB/PioB family outer membrane beta-barrel protein [Clostridia bacterium]